MSETTFELDLRFTLFSDSIVKDVEKFIEQDFIQKEIQDLINELKNAIESEIGHPPIYHITALVLPKMRFDEHEICLKEGLTYINVLIRVTCNEWYRSALWKKSPPEKVFRMDISPDNPIVYLLESPWIKWAFGDEIKDVNNDILGMYAYKNEAIPMIKGYLGQFGYIDVDVKPK